MNKNVLIDAGIGYDDAVRRFAGHAPIYEKYLCKFITDKEFKLLRDAMHENDYGAAFRLAHTLKGISANLGMTDFFSSLDTLVELLRDSADIPQATRVFSQVNNEYNRCISAISAYFSGEKAASGTI